jgi:hypothetical protein
MVNTDFNIILPSMARSRELSLPLRFLDIHFLWNSYLLACYISLLPHFPYFNRQHKHLFPSDVPVHPVISTENLAGISNLPQSFLISAYTHVRSSLREELYVTKYHTRLRSLRVAIILKICWLWMMIMIIYDCHMLNGCNGKKQCCSLRSRIFARCACVLGEMLKVHFVQLIAVIMTNSVLAWPPFPHMPSWHSAWLHY